MWNSFFLVATIQSGTKPRDTRDNMSNVEWPMPFSFFLLTVILTRIGTISRARIANLSIYFLFKILSFLVLDILHYTHQYTENPCNSCHNVDITLYLHVLWVILRLQFWRRPPIAGDCRFATVGRPHVRTLSTTQVPYPLSETDTFLVSRLHYKLVFTSWQEVSIIGLFFVFHASLLLHVCWRYRKNN